MVLWRLWGVSDGDAGLLERVKARRMSRERRLGNGELKWDEAKGQRAACKSE